MDLSKFLNIVYRYVWLFILIVLVASLTTYFVVSNQPVNYRATTKLLVGPTLDSPSPDLNALKIGGQLIQTYAEVVGTRSFLEAVNNKLDQKMDLDALDLIISARQNTETRILTINARSTDPKQAIEVANAAAQTLVEVSPSQDNTTALLRSQMSTQSHQLEEIVGKAEASIQQLETELTALKNAKPLSPEAVQANLDQQTLIIRQLSDERSRMSDALRTLATVYQVLLDTNTNQLEIVEPAETAVASAQNLWLRVGTSAFSGLVLALIVIFIVEYLDDRIRFPGEFVKNTGIPVLSVINKHNRLQGTGTDGFVTLSQPDSLAANGYREAVAKLLFAIGKEMPYTLLLTSVGQKAGDDTVAAIGNLAVEFANAGSRVVLVDAQFHNPALTRIFNAENKEGFSDAIVTSSSKPSILPLDEIPGVHFLPAGLAGEKGSGAMLNPAKLLNLIEGLQQDADIVLIAASPVAWFGETLNLAAKSNSVLLVAHQGDVHGKTVNAVVENLHVMQIKVAGVLFDYNASPYSTEANRGRSSWIGRTFSKVSLSKPSGKVEKSSVAEQMTKS